MKKKIKNFINKNKKYLIILFIGFLFMLVGYISWEVYFSKIEIFKAEEKKLIEAGKTYYKFRQQYLPKDGEFREVDLETLYKNVEMDGLYVPKTKKMCNSKSWVRVYNTKEKYTYIAYLDCGKYKSDVDHKGPEIKLNGSNTLYVALGNKYEELGIKEVIDDKDGKIDSKQVEIDSSKVNTDEIGEYVVKYSVKDSNYNETVITRKIIVSKGLTDTVRKFADSEGYYVTDSNNYILFSGMLWRIIKVNTDGTIKIILDEPSSNLRVNYDKYEDSNVDMWLNNYFYGALTNPDKYLVDAEYCVGSINSMLDYSNYCSEKVIRKVGLLDINEYYKMGTDVNSKVYSKSFLLGNLIGNNFANADFVNGDVQGVTKDLLPGVRPVITIKNDFNILYGDGSYSNPYKLNDYQTAKKSDKLDTRLVGEYFYYSGMPFRILNVDKDKNIRAIMADYWFIQPDATPVYISYDELQETMFNVKEENNPGFIINNEFLDYIDSKNLATTEYDIPLNDPSKKYNEYKNTKVKAKILLPKTSELFSAVSRESYMISYIDSSLGENFIYVANGKTGLVFELAGNSFSTYAVKGIITLEGNFRIESGNGTITKPFKIK